MGMSNVRETYNIYIREYHILVSNNVERDVYGKCFSTRFVILCQTHAHASLCHRDTFLPARWR